MSNVPSQVTVDIQQIADIAGVGRSAVGNWRKRHDDFPVPNSSGEFDLREVERWLIERGKIDGRVPAAFEAWSLADSLRGTLVAEDTTEFLTAVLVYLQATEEPSLLGPRGAYELTVPDSASWAQVRQAAPDALPGALLDAAAALEGANPVLEGLLTPGMSKAPLVAGRILPRLIDALERASGETPYFDLFEEVVARASDLDRFRGEYSTPEDVTELMVRLAGARRGTVLDLAAGEGGLLLSAAIHPDRPSGSNLVGYEINESALRLARSRFFLYDVAVDLRLGDALRVPADELPEADLVLLDPPLAMVNWGDADVYLDARWRFGVPPRSKGDFAWLQLAIERLTEGGRAVVASSLATTSRGGGEAHIRRAMIESGVVHAVIQLPTRLRPNTSIPLAIWVLQPTAPEHDVLMIDASGLGTTGRSLHSFEEADIVRIVEALRTYEQGQLDDFEIAWVVSAEDLIADGTNLEPSRFRPLSEVNTDAARQRAAELRSLVPAASVAASDAVQRLMAHLEEGGR